MPDTQAAGVIHDLGYRGYDGPRLGRARIVRALTWHSFRSAFGIGRGVKGKIIPVLAMIAMCLPALVNAFAVARGNQRLFGYDVYVPGLRAAWSSSSSPRRPPSSSPGTCAAASCRCTSARPLGAATTRWPSTSR